MEIKNLRTVAQYAREKDVSAKTVYLWIKEGKIKYKQFGKLKFVIVK